MASTQLSVSSEIANDVVRRDMKALLRLPGFDFVKQNPLSYTTRKHVFKVLHACLRYEKECGRRRPNEAKIAFRITLLVNACIDGLVKLRKQYSGVHRSLIASRLVTRDFWDRVAKSLNCYRDGKLDTFIMGCDARVIMTIYVRAQALRDNNEAMDKELQPAQDVMPVQHIPEVQALHDALRNWRKIAPSSYMDTRRYPLWEDFPAEATDETSQPDSTGAISQHDPTSSISQLDANASNTNSEMAPSQTLAEIETLKKQLGDVQSHLMTIREQNESLSKANETLRDRYYHANDHYELWFEKPWLDFITRANKRRVVRQMATLGGGDLKKFLREQWPHYYPKDN
ncbi:hypothetical protein SCAR479_13489 [Seiridium cardinale]|uniref:Uncharacterized protein n=1 Tax=Seiridium cardinale TaxID=138064 RepID=A0ABR2X7X5_9PEZI